MHQKVDKTKILIYVITFFTLSTLNTISPKFFFFPKIDKIKISGLSEENNLIMLKEFDYLKMHNIFFLIEEDFKKVVEKNNLVEDFYVIKQYPTTLYIKLRKTNFLAKIILDNENFVIGSNGKIIPYDSQDEQLPYLEGAPDSEEFLRFFNIVKKTNFKYTQIQKIFFFPSKRWDIKTKNGILIRLPKENLDDALNLSYNLINDIRFINTKSIDLRVYNQIILNEK